MTTKPRTVQETQAQILDALVHGDEAVDAALQAGAQAIRRLAALLEAVPRLQDQENKDFSAALLPVDPSASPTTTGSLPYTPYDHDCRNWNSGGACLICRRPLTIEEQTETESGYNFDHEALLVCNAIGSPNGHGTVTAALMEAYVAGAQSQVGSGSVVEGEASPDTAQERSAKDTPTIEGTEPRLNLEQADQAVWDAAWALHDPEPNGQQWRRSKALKDAIDALVSSIDRQDRG